MHLCDRGGRDRLTERREQVGGRFAQGGRDRAFGLRLRERRHLVLQCLEVARQCYADHVWPRRQELTELDIGRAEPGKGGSDTVRRDRACRPFDQSCEAHSRPRRRRQQRDVDAREYALAREDETGVGKADELGRTCNHNRQPECSATMPPLMR